MEWVSEKLAVLNAAFVPLLLDVIGPLVSREEEVGTTAGCIATLGCEAFCRTRTLQLGRRARCGSLKFIDFSAHLIEVYEKNRL